MWIISLELGTYIGSVLLRSSLTSLAAVVYAFKQTYEMSGVASHDIDIAKVQDCFTIDETIAYEDLELCKRGDGGTFIENKQFYIAATY